jgi:hypothetical protein
MSESIDEFKPIKEASNEAKALFKNLCALERENLHRENPQIDDMVINLVRSLVK